MHQYQSIHNQSSPGINIIGFDIEWTKNYKIKNGNEPFCFSFIIINVADGKNLLINNNVRFSFIARYVESRSDISCLIEDANKIIPSLWGPMSIITGHQLSSDISILIMNGTKYGVAIDNIQKLRTYWHNRKSLFVDQKIFDSRYDIDSILKGQSRRLVDVCAECDLLVKQPEIMGSMTKMQNEYYDNKNRMTMEKLMILNIRHSLSSALLYFIAKNGKKPKSVLNVNEILYNNLSKHYSYIKSGEFKRLLTLN